MSQYDVVSYTTAPDTIQCSRPRRKTDSAVNKPFHLREKQQQDQDGSSDYCYYYPDHLAGPSWASTAWTPLSPASTASSSIHRHQYQHQDPHLAPPSRRRPREPLSLAGVRMAATAGDPRDTLGPSSPARPEEQPRAVTTTISSSSYSFSSSTPSATTTSAAAASSHPLRPHPILTSLPQSRFSFECQPPSHTRSSTSHRSSTINSPSSVGPDPSPTPQRSVLYDRPRRSVPNFSWTSVKSDRPSSYSVTRSSSPLLATERKSTVALPLDADSALDALSPNASKRRKQSAHLSHQSPLRVNAKQKMPASTLTYVQDRANGNRAVNGIEKRGSEDITGRTDDTTRSKNEDVFLNIARSDSGRRDSFNRSELRRSRFSQSLRSPTSRVHEPTSSDQTPFHNPETPLHSNNVSPSYGSVTRTHSLSAHPLEDHSRRYSGPVTSSRSVIGLPRSRLSRTSPDASPESAERRASLNEPRLFRHSTLSTIRSARHVSGSEATERPRVDTEQARQDGTESTLSTNAPSTVWDELEDLKSRIRKLELTGKLPPSSQAAISSVANERPRTATTTVTTLSASPKTGRKVNPPVQDFGENTVVLSQVHPLLQSALVKSKSSLSNDVYNALEATVTDALALSTLLGSGNAPSSGSSMVNGYGTSDRQSRRKADSVCRGLTELCLALTDDRHQQPPNRDDLRRSQRADGPEEDSSVPTVPLQRAATLEPESLSRRRSNSRVTSRLESRRASLANINVSNDDPPPPLPDTKPTQLPSKEPLPTRRLSRLSSLRTRKAQLDDENADNENPHKRTISRAMTEIATPNTTDRVPPRQRASHQYTGSRPNLNTQQTNQNYSTQTQTQVPRTPTLSQSGIPLRRSFMSPVTPATTRSNIQAGSRRYGIPSSFAPSTTGRARAESNVDATPFSQQGPSQTRIAAPSSKVATSYTPIQQNRARANSLGVRRFGLRQRPMATSDDAVNALNDSID